MKLLGFAIFALVCGPIFAANLPLKAKECSVGPSFWCQNLTSAKTCGAVKHCIQTVWEKQTVPEDNDSVCKICVDMVTQARDQLESNETQDELKQVFEGSCKLIVLKPIVKECIKLADDFIPELVETLASQMNPQMVCSVAGLCNSAHIDELLAQQAVEVIPATKLIQSTKVESQSCSDCKVVGAAMHDKFLATSRDDLLNNMMEVCGRLSSFSDACSAIVITHFNAIYTHLENHLNAEEVCNLVGTCDAQFHQHVKEVEVTNESKTGVIERKTGDDLPCELCEKLVAHLQDILVANTTEAEFQVVLDGLCKQTGSFQDECLSIVSQYYGLIYNYLVKALVPKETCALAGLCPQPSSQVSASVIAPLVPVETAEVYKGLSLTPAIKQTPLAHVNIGESAAEVSSVKVAIPQLPIERLIPQAMVSNSAVCTLCEYLLHYLQETITNPDSEAEIKQAVDQACDHLPSSIENQCRDFVETYGDAIVSILAQEFDPSLVCPELGFCPSLTIVDINKPPVNDKASCPLCLFAVQELTTKLSDNKTEASIKVALDNLCEHLPKSLVKECRQFVESYEEQLVDMLIADFTPQEVCVYLRLCDDNTVTSTIAPEIMSNAIPEIHPIAKSGDSTQCVICEFVLSKIDTLLKNQSTEAEIKDAVLGACNYLPKTVAKECQEFVNQYADLVITLLAQTLNPKEICTEIKLCTSASFFKKKAFTKNVEECMVCEATLGALEGLLDDPTVESEVGAKLAKACNALPATRQDQCRTMVSVYGPSIINLVTHLFGGRRVCEKIGLCDTYVAKVELLGGKKCTWGPGYWCQSENHAQSCGATKHCQQKVWLGATPSKRNN